MNTFNAILVVSLATSLAICAEGALAEVAAPSGTVCETQTAPVMPRLVPRQNGPDEVKVRALIRDGIVQNVQILKGPHLYAAAIREAMAKYQCRIEASDYWVNQEFVFDTRED